MSTFTRKHANDLRGYGRLAADATSEVASVIESLHHTITRWPALFGVAPADTTRGITGFVYASIRAGAWLAARGLDAALTTLTPWLPEGSPTPRQEAVRAAVNGVYGDYLAATANTLAIPMRLRRDGHPLTLTRAGLAEAIPNASRRVLVLVHGLCTNDLQWRRNGHDHGAALARDLGCTPVYLHYNSGLHVADNGLEFAATLETLASEWPVRLEELTIIGHSMGGLIARSAVEAARAAQYGWLIRLRRLVFLGTPHQGALFEQLGSWVEAALRARPYSAPFARLGAARSAGITDLRYGSVSTKRRTVPLPAGIDCFAIAATLGPRPRPVRDQLVGDGLVPLDSALGLHARPEHALAFLPERQWIARRTTHLELLSSTGVYTQLHEWLAG
jgi:pimeloyl-ACP methyl ester carboxylesterase